MVTGDDLDVLGEASSAYAADFPRPGWAEQDAGLWERALAPTIAAALERAGRAPADVRALGVAGQLDGCVPVGGDGRAIGPCLIWMDRRAAELMPELPADFGAATGLVADATHMAAKIRWLRRKASTPANRFHQPVSYLVSRLIGRHVFDHGLASTTMLYSLRGRDYDDGLLARFEVDRAAVPEIAEASDCAGRLHADGAALSGLPIGTPVAVGTGDDFATPLGAGVARPGSIACVLGTAEVVGAVSDVLVLDDRGLLETHGYANARYFVENPGWLAGGALAWLADLLGVAGFEELDTLAQQTPPGADGLTFVPALSGAMAPEWIADARACFHGFTPAHGRAHLARAVMEGCAFAMRDVVDRLRALRVPGDRLLLLGGGARSRVWTQMRADVVGLPAGVAARVDTCPVGAAALAAVAGGVQPDLESSAALVGGETRVLLPDGASSAAYASAYSAYQSLFECLRPMWRGSLEDKDTAH